MAAPESTTPLNIGRDDDMVVFGKYQLFPNLGLLMKEGVRLELGERAMAVLIHLVSMAGQVVSKDQLLEKVWPQEVVEENNLQAQISSPSQHSALSLSKLMRWIALPTAIE